MIIAFGIIYTMNLLFKVAEKLNNQRIQYHDIASHVFGKKGKLLV